MEKKFRAWDKENKRFIADDFYVKDGVAYILDDDGACGDPECCGESSSFMSEVSTEYELQQFTGLKDKNGKMIFEGDIIDWGGLKPLKIIFKDCCYRVKGFGSEDVLNLTQKGATMFAEIIGNIYENENFIKK